MDKIVWTDKFSVGNENMDFQHQKLIRMINVLIEHNNADTDTENEIVSDLLTKMTEYSLEHLRSEEQLLEELAYPHLDEHKKLHNAYRLKVVDFCTATSIGVKNLTPSMLAYLSQWWTGHILAEDMKYNEWLSQR